MKSVLIVRLILVALTAALAVVLFLHGNVVIGVLIGAMALLRIFVYMRMRGRREEIRRRVAQRRGFPDPQ